MPAKPRKFAQPIALEYLKRNAQAEQGRSRKCNAPLRAGPISRFCRSAISLALVGRRRIAEGRGGRVFVGGSDLRFASYGDSFLYHLLLPDQTPASYFLELNPGTVNRRGTRLTRDLRRAEVVILSDRYDAWTEPNDSVVPGDPGPARVLRRDFEFVARHGPFAIYLRQ